MIEDIMENEKYEGMKKERKIEPDGNGEDNNRRKIAVMSPTCCLEHLKKIAAIAQTQIIIL